MKSICVIAGMPRSATTYLYHTLALHPSVFVPARKELEYFSLNFHRGILWYEDFFSTMKPRETGFDISPIYFFSPNVPERIVDWNPDQPVVLIIRNPAEFIVSFFKNRVAASTEFLEFEDFVELCSYSKDGQTMHFNLEPGSIEENIERFRNVIGNNLLLADFRSVQDDPIQILSSIEDFLDLGKFFIDGNFDRSPVNSGDQLNIKFVNRLMHKKWFSDLIIRLIPKKLILAFRHKLQTTKRKSGSLVSKELETRISELSNSRYSNDIDFVNRLFADSPFVLGGGDPLWNRPSNNISQADRKTE